MPLILLGWLILIVSAIAISALLIFPPRSRGSRREQLDVETCKACLEDIGSQILSLPYETISQPTKQKPTLPDLLSSLSRGHRTGATVKTFEVPPGNLLRLLRSFSSLPELAQLLLMCGILPRR